MNKGRQPSTEGSDQELWELLGRSERTGAGPMFSRKVVREIRLSEESESSKRGFRDWLSMFSFSSSLQVAGAAALVAMAFWLVMGDRQDTDRAETVADVPVLEHEEELETYTDQIESIESFGELMAVADPASLSDEALMNLLF